jgi:hypothetical protein
VNITAALNQTRLNVAVTEQTESNYSSQIPQMRGKVKPRYYPKTFGATAREGKAFHGNEGEVAGL